MVWIHGGGYGLGHGGQDMSEFIKDNEGKFLVVSIQYRVRHFNSYFAQIQHNCQSNRTELRGYANLELS